MIKLTSSISRRLSLLLLCFLSFGVSAGTLDRIKQSGKITFGYVAEARPFSFGESSQPSGYAIDVCKQIADSLKTELGLSALTVNFVSYAHEDALKSVSQGKVDLFCDPVPPTLGSRKEVAYSVPIFASGVSVVVRREGSTRLKEILSGHEPKRLPSWRANADQVLQKSTLSVVSGGRAEKVLNERLKELKLAATVYPVEDFDAGVARVAENRTDAFFGDRAVLLDAVKRSGKSAKLEVLDRYFTHEVGAFVLPRGDEEFRTAVDRSLSRLYRSEGFKAIYAKWFGPPSENVTMFFNLIELPD